MKNVHCAGHTLIEALIALLILSSTWPGVETIVHQNAVNNFSNTSYIQNILTQMSRYEKSL